MSESRRASRAYALVPKLSVALLSFALPLSASAAGGLELVPDTTMLLALIVLFVVLVFPVNELLFKPIFKVLDEREQRIAGTRSRAEQLERDAQEALNRYESSVQSVREEAEQERRSLLEAARNEALAATGEVRGEVEREIDNAREQIRGSLDRARATLRGQSQDLAREAASRVLGRAL